MENDFSARLARLEDFIDLYRLEASYASLYDGGQGEKWANLFTEDGIYQGRQLEGMGDTTFVQGSKALADFCNSNPMRAIHYLNLPDVTIDGTKAEGKVHFTFRGYEIDRYKRVLTTRSEGAYDCTYQKVAGAWKIRRRFTVYYERSKQHTFGYEDSRSPQGAKNPDFDRNAP